MSFRSNLPTLQYQPQNFLTPIHDLFCFFASGKKAFDGEKISKNSKSGKLFGPGKSDDTVNRMPVNRMMTVVIIITHNYSNGQKSAYFLHLNLSTWTVFVI